MTETHTNTPALCPMLHSGMTNKRVRIRILTGSRWANKLLALGNKRPLNASDLWPLCPDEKSALLCASFEEAWEKEISKPKYGD